MSIHIKLICHCILCIFIFERTSMGFFLLGGKKNFWERLFGHHIFMSLENKILFHDDIKLC